MPFLERQRQRIFYEVKGSGPAIVLGHSFLCTGGMWEKQLPVLVDSFRTVNIDYRGHGQSSRIESDFDVANETLILSTVRISLHGDVENAEAELRRILDLPGHENAAGADSPDRSRLSQELDGWPQLIAGRLEHGRRLAAGHNQPVQIRNLLRIENAYGVYAELCESPFVRGATPLQGQDADVHDSHQA